MIRFNKTISGYQITFRREVRKSEKSTVACIMLLGATVLCRVSGSAASSLAHHCSMTNSFDSHKILCVCVCVCVCVLHVHYMIVHT